MYWLGPSELGRSHTARKDVLEAAYKAIWDKYFTLKHSNFWATEPRKIQSLF